MNVGKVGLLKIISKTVAFITSAIIIPHLRKSYRLSQIHLNLLTMMTTITQGLDSVRQSIQQSAANHQRLAADIRLIAVSKRHSVACIRTAFQHQQRDFGENYLNEALEKQTRLADLAITWHYIGSIQSNKTRKIAEHFDWVHTVDSLKIAKRLSAQRPLHLPPLNICLQINIDQEASKSGLAPTLEPLTELLGEIIQLPQITLRGLMCIPAPKAGKEQEKASFTQMQGLLKQLNQRLTQSSGLPLDTLSMGMSDDLDSAIACGATMVRVGTAIFGQR